MNENIIKLHTLLFSALSLNSPILSGNMKQHITSKGTEIMIEAPFYDMKEWKKSGSIVHTGKTIHGFTDYAYWVNEIGAFGTHNKSEGWVNRTILDVVTAIANEIGAVVIDRVGL